VRNSPLRDKKILLTRPEGVSNKLYNRINAAGGRAIHLPSMVITPLLNAGEAGQLPERLQDFDVLIFVSRNAVKYASELMPDIVSQAADKKIFAIGTGTREELQGIGLSNVSYTDSNTGSDALLDMRELQPARLANTKIMILRGVGGRGILGDELLARGAKVQYVELYRRAMPDIGPATMKHIWLSEQPDAVLVTSAEGLRNLLEMTGAEERPLFLNTRLVVISQRLKDVAESCGFTATIKVAEGYSDDDFMLALVKMFEVKEDEQ